jgi:enoyl-CoA hydratase/carnithine racemase
MTDNYEDIRYEVRDRVGWITLDRPAKLNAWTAAMERSVKRALGAADHDDAVRAIVVTGAGRGFCAGADMGLLEGLTTAAPDTRALARSDVSKPVGPTGGGMAPALRGGAMSVLGPDVSAHYGGRFGYLMSVRKPIIAAINGPCAGIGLVFTCFCDVRFAAEQAVITTAFAQRGLIAEHGISWLLPRLVGPSRALELLLSARKLSGAEAEQLGLVNKAFPAERFVDEVTAYASRLAQTVSPRSLAVMKAQVWKSLFQDFEQALATADQEMLESFESEDFKEGVAHFVEKRPPRFSGR